MAFLVVVAFLEETLGVAVFLTVGFEAALTLDLLDAEIFLALSAASLEAILLELSEAGFFTAFATAVFFGFSLVDDGFFVVVVLLLVEVGFLF